MRSAENQETATSPEDILRGQRAERPQNNFDRFPDQSSDEESEMGESSEEEYEMMLEVLRE